MVRLTRSFPPSCFRVASSRAIPHAGTRCASGNTGQQLSFWTYPLDSNAGVLPASSCKAQALARHLSGGYEVYPCGGVQGVSMAGTDQRCTVLQREAAERLLRRALTRRRQARGRRAGLVTGARPTSGARNCREFESAGYRCARSGREGCGRRCPRGGVCCGTCGARQDSCADGAVHLTFTLAARYAGLGGTIRPPRTGVMHSGQALPPCRVCGRGPRNRLGGSQRHFAHRRASPAVRGGRVVGATPRASRQVGRPELRGLGRGRSRPTNIANHVVPTGSPARTSCAPPEPPTEPQGNAGVPPRRCNTGHVTEQYAHRTGAEWTGIGTRARRPNRSAKSDLAGAGPSAVPLVSQVIPVKRPGHEGPTAPTRKRPLTASNVVSGCVVHGFGARGDSPGAALCDKSPVEGSYENAPCGAVSDGVSGSGR